MTAGLPSNSLRVPALRRARAEWGLRKGTDTRTRGARQLAQPAVTHAMTCYNARAIAPTGARLRRSTASVVRPSELGPRALPEAGVVARCTIAALAGLRAWRLAAWAGTGSPPMQIAAAAAFLAG